MPNNREPNLSKMESPQPDEGVLAGDFLAGHTGVAELLAQTRTFLAHLPEQHRNRLMLVVEEIVVNIVNHGNVPADSKIKYRFVSEPSNMQLSFIDRGIAFDPRTDIALTKGEATEPVVGGLGWPLVLSWCRIVDYQRREGRNHLQLEFPLSSANDRSDD